MERSEKGIGGEFGERERRGVRGGDEEERERGVKGGGVGGCGAEEEHFCDFGGRGGGGDVVRLVIYLGRTYRGRTGTAVGM